MHKTLTIRSNIVLAVLWAGLLAAMLWLAWPLAVPSTGVTFAIGGVAGLAQAQALTASAGAFRNAGSATEVRKVMMQTRAGRLSIMLLWAACAAAVVWALAFGASKAFPVALSAYAAFALARELVSLPGLVRLAKESREGTTPS